jgi:hypothetical protein
MSWENYKMFSFHFRNNTSLGILRGFTLCTVLLHLRSGSIFCKFCDKMAATWTGIWVKSLKIQWVYATFSRFRTNDRSFKNSRLPTFIKIHFICEHRTILMRSTTKQDLDKLVDTWEWTFNECILPRCSFSFGEWANREKKLYTCTCVQL